jgi:hypothetical protein
MDLDWRAIFEIVRSPPDELYDLDDLDGVFGVRGVCVGLLGTGATPRKRPPGRHGVLILPASFRSG